jgi:branched-chain amino acid transport system ATP-binding protein
MGLDVSGVTVRFGGLTALSDVSFEVRSGVVTGLIGPNGAGKTTLFNVVTGLQRPAAGTVRLDGRDLRGLTPFARARLGLGRTFQRLELFGTLTVRENISVAASIGRRNKATRTSESITDITSRLIAEVGLGRVADERADVLPTGTGRLVEVARALAVHPKILLLDEPASGQDASETLQFAVMLRSLADRGLAVLLVEHDMELVMSVCDEVVVLDYGEVLQIGSPHVVQSDPAVRKAYLGTVNEVAHG